MFTRVHETLAHIFALLQAAVLELEEAVLASDQQPSPQGRTPLRTGASASGQAPVPLPLSQSAGQPASVGTQLQASESQPQSNTPLVISADPSSNAKTSGPKLAEAGRSEESHALAVAQVPCLLHSPSNQASEHAYHDSTATDDHLNHHRLNSESNCAMSSSSSRSDEDSQPVTPASDASDTQALTVPINRASEAQSSGHDVHQHVAVLSVLAGVAADPASALAQSDTCGGPGASTQNGPSAFSEAGTSGAEERVAASRSASGSSIDIYDALRDDKPHVADWQLVKPNRKGSASSSKAASDRGGKSAASQQHGAASRGREKSAESQEAAHMNGDASLVAKPVRRSSSQASVSSWASAETTEGPDRYRGPFAEDLIAFESFVV